MTITKMHSPVKSRVLGKVVTLNTLEEEGVLELFERKKLDSRGDFVIKYYAKIPNTDELWEISPIAFKSRTE